MDIVTPPAPEAPQYRDQRRVTTSVLLKMVGCNVATPADTSGTPAPSDVTRTFSTNVATYVRAGAPPATAATSP